VTARAPWPHVRVVPSAPEHAEALEELQRVCFPYLSDAERMRAEHFLRHLEVFPEGEFVAVTDRTPDGEELGREVVVGLGSGFLTRFDLDHPHHSFLEAIAGGTYARHDPAGDWYYGADLSVHPDYRRKGIGGLLYRARQDLVRRLGLRGIVAGGALPGYGRYKGVMSVAAYVAAVARGELGDPTLSFQLANGFEALGVIEGYMTDPETGDAASLIVWRNPDRRED